MVIDLASNARSFLGLVEKVTCTVFHGARYATFWGQTVFRVKFGPAIPYIFAQFWQITSAVIKKLFVFNTLKMSCP